MRKSVRLKDICSIQTGPFGTQLHAADYVSEGTPIITVEHLVDGKIERSGLPRVRSADAKRLARFSLKRGDLVFSRVGAVDRCALVGFGEEGWLFSGRLLRVRPGSDMVYSRYLYHYLWGERQRSWIRGNSVGSTMRSLNTEILSRFPIDLPGLKVQHDIVEVLDLLDEISDASESGVEKLRTARWSHVQRILLRSPSQSWTDGRVEDFGEVRMGRQRSPRHESGPSMAPYLRVANVFDGHIDYSDVLNMNFSPAEKVVYGLRAGDILLNEGQSLDLVGRSAIYDGEPDSYFFQNTLIRYRCAGSLLPKFAQLVFSAWLKWGYFSRVAFQTTSIAHLGADRFAQMGMSVPSLEEQRRIVSIIEAHDERITAERARLEKLRKLKAGLMDDLLIGRVRVDQLKDLPV